MTALKTSIAWQGFRHSNLVTTSTPVQVGKHGDAVDSDESSGAEDNGFVGAERRSQEMMMEIMDKYVQAGEALADRENDVRQLSKQVEELKLQDSELEEQIADLMKVNEKLADDMGRWHSLARELGDQVRILKKGETYRLFQDRLDETEARLEVSQDSRSILKKRLEEVFTTLSPDFTPRADEGIDEHHQYDALLVQLRGLKSTCQTLDASLAHCKEDRDAARLEVLEGQARQALTERNAEMRLAELEHDIATRDAKAMSNQDLLREAMAEQADWLRQAQEDAASFKDACAAAEAKTKRTEESRQNVANDAEEARERLGRAMHDIQTVKDQSKCLESNLADVTLELGQAQEEVSARRQAQELAETSNQAASARIVELERLLTDVRSRESELLSDIGQLRSQKVQLGKDLEASMHQVLELRKMTEELEVQVHSSEGRATKAEMDVASQLATLRETSQKLAATEESAMADHDALHAAASRVEELEHHLHDVRGQLQETEATASLTASKLVAASEETMEARTVSEGLHQQVEEMGAEVARVRSEATRSDDACRIAEASCGIAENARIEAESGRVAAESARAEAEQALAEALSSIKVLEDALTVKDANLEEIRLTTDQMNHARIAAEKSAHAVSQTLAKAQEDFRQAIKEKSEATHALEVSRKSSKDVEDSLRGLKAELGESRRVMKHYEARIREQDILMHGTREEAKKLKEDLLATQARLEERASVTQASVTATPGTLHNACPFEPMPCNANASFEVAPLDQCGSNGAEAAAKTTNGTANNTQFSASTPSEGEKHDTEAFSKLQAHTEAVELELRYTLESFEGQLSAMAREKVALQKQTKELSGQCTTLRKQVSHYKRLSKESEAQAEQIQELQQQLCDMEAAAEQLRVERSELVSKVEALEVHERQISLWSETKDQNQELRAQVELMMEHDSAKSQELSFKTQELASSRTCQTALATKLDGMEADLSALKENLESTTIQLAQARESLTSTAAELTVAREKVKELEHSADETAKLEVTVIQMKDERTRAAKQAWVEREKLEVTIQALRKDQVRSLEAERDYLQERQRLLEQLDTIAALLGNEKNMDVLVPECILGNITALQQRLVKTEAVVQDTAAAFGKTFKQALCTDEFQEDLASEGSSWIVCEVVHAQRRLQQAEIELSESIQARCELEDCKVVLEGLSAMLECDRNSVTSKVNELRKLVHELVRSEEGHLENIEELKQELAKTPPQISHDSAMVGTTGNISAVAESYLGQKETRSRETHPKIDGSDLDSIPNNGAESPSTSNSAEKRYAQQANGAGIITLKDSHAFPATRTGLLNAERLLGQVQYMLECKADEVIDALTKRQSMAEQQQQTLHVLCEVKRSYVHSMEALAASISHEASLEVSHMLAQASALSRDVSLSNRKDLELLDEVTSILASLIRDTVSRESEAQEKIACTRDTLREERLMMMAFRRWGHFYLALSNQALRKRTKERNQARAQRHISDKSSNGGDWQSADEPGEAGHVSISPTDIRAMVSEEMENVVRELVDEPTPALVELNDTRKVMDEMAFKAKATMNAVRALPPPMESMNGLTYGKGENGAYGENMGEERGIPTADPSNITDSGHSGGHAQICTTGRVVHDHHRLGAASISFEATEQVPCPTDSLPAEVTFNPSPSRERSLLKPSTQQAPTTVIISLTKPDEALRGDLGSPANNLLESPPRLVSSSKVVPQMHLDEVCVSQIAYQTESNQESHGHSSAECILEGLSCDVASEENFKTSTRQATIRPEISEAATQREPDRYSESQATDLPDQGDETEVATSPPAELSVARVSSPPPVGTADGARRSGATSIRTVRTTGPLVEDGISKEERVAYLRRQREARKANRKRGGPSTLRLKAEPITEVGFPSRRTPSPVGQLETSAFATVPSPQPSNALHTISAPDGAETVLAAVPGNDDGAPESRQTPTPPVPENEAGTAVSTRAGIESTPNIEVIPPPVAVAPPRMFNPTAIPPPTVSALGTATNTQCQPSIHPSIAFSVNETIEKALKLAECEAEVAQRRALFWRCRCRDVVVWAASFAVLSFASDRSFTDCW